VTIFWCLFLEVAIGWKIDEEICWAIGYFSFLFL